MKKRKSILQFSQLLPVAILLFSIFYLIGNKLFVNPAVSVHADDTTPTASPTTTAKTLTFRTSVSAQGIFNGQGMRVTLPSTIQSGDLLVAVAGTNGPKSFWSGPAGWTQGTNSNATDTQAITWWWKVADGSEGGSQAVFKSSRYADGGIVVNVYAGEAADPIAGVSRFTTTDNFGNGHVFTANVSGITTDNTVTAVPLIFASWQPNATTVTWPVNVTFESAADDGYSYVGVGEVLSSLTDTQFPGSTLSFSTGEAVVQTLQVLIKLR